jgi:hypothetical protein
MYFHASYTLSPAILHVLPQHFTMVSPLDRQLNRVFKKSDSGSGTGSGFENFPKNRVLGSGSIPGTGSFASLVFTESKNNNFIKMQAFQKYLKFQEANCDVLLNFREVSKEKT